jgi:phage protein U
MTREKFTQNKSMGKLGDFTFYMHKNGYQKISQTLSAKFGSHKPIKGQESLNDSGGYEHTLSLNGVLVVQPLKALESLEDYVKRREPIRLTTLTHDISVVITNLSLEKSHFLDDGKFMAQTYTLSLKEVFDD